MPEANEQLTLKKIVGAVLFAAKKPLRPDEIRKLFADTAEMEDEPVCHLFAKVKESEIAAALEQIKIEHLQSADGIQLLETAGGFRLQTEPECSPWLRRLLNTGRPSRLSKPTLETLAIIAYRQPVARAEIEGVRGVSVDAIVRHLLECRLIRITGRSSLPGHPLLYGTTQFFLEHFGLQSIEHLPGIEQLRRKEEERARGAGRQKNKQEEQTDDDFDEDDEEEDADEESGKDASAQINQPPPAADNKK